MHMLRHCGVHPLYFGGDLTKNGNRYDSSFEAKDVMPDKLRISFFLTVVQWL